MAKNNPTATKKKKRKSTKKNYRQTIITVLMVLALIAFVLPDLMPLFTGGSSNRPAATSSSSTSSKPATMPEPTFTKEGQLSLISGKTGEVIKDIDIEKADNEKERTIGMMYRKSMPDTQGMLFIFDKSEPQSFWMRNTLIPLDIIFIGEDKTINTIHSNATPLSEQSLPANEDSKYVLEVRGGFCLQYGVEVGDKIDWQ